MDTVNSIRKPEWHAARGGELPEDLDTVTRLRPRPDLSGKCEQRRGEAVFVVLQGLQVAAELLVVAEGFAAPLPLADAAGGALELGCGVSEVAAA